MIKFHKIGIVAALAFLCMFCNNQQQKSSQTEAAVQGEGKVVQNHPSENNAEAALPQTYSRADYGFEVHFPKAWQALDYPGQQGQSFVVNLFPAGRNIEAKTPLRVHAGAAHTFIAVLPKGWGTELPSGAVQSFAEAKPSLPLSFAVDQNSSKVFSLQNGEAWGYFIMPADPPSSWKNGFVFAQAGVADFAAECYDKSTGKEKPQSQCDPLAGDKVVRKGRVKKDDAAALKQVLSSLRFHNVETNTEAVQIIRVEQPLPNSEVTSPLQVGGEAKGPWFFEGSFSVALYNAAGKKLAEVPAKADGKWMTEDFVPFNATLRFTAPNDERGRLVFRKANPSGLEKNDASYSVPVLFPLKR